MSCLSSPKLSTHHISGNPLQFLFKPIRVFMSSSLNSKSNSWQEEQKTPLRLQQNLFCMNQILHREAHTKSDTLTSSYLVEQTCTWRFSSIRRGVTDLAMTITFLWMWNLSRTWVKQCVRSPNSNYSTIQCLTGHCSSLYLYILYPLWFYRNILCLPALQSFYAY